MKKILIIPLIIILVSILISVLLYPQMPDQMASHWNEKGEVDGHMSKFWGLFLMPIILIVVVLLLVFIPLLDPLKANIEKFRKHYEGFIVVLVLFFFYIHVLTLIWNTGRYFDMGQLMSPGLAILFFYIGILVENAKRNWFIGIRTPWTLSSPKVWDKTHKRGGFLFKIAAVIVFLAVFFPDQALWLILIPILFVVVYTIVYSYLEYRKEKK